MRVDVELLSKPGCHLCDHARDITHDVLTEYGDKVRFSERNILDDEALTAKFGDEIPVLRLDGKVHTIWRVDPSRLRVALDRLTGQRP